MPSTDHDERTGISISKAALFKGVLALLSAAVPFLIGWAIKLEINKAEMRFEINALKEKVTAAQSISAGVSQNTMTLGRMDERIDGINRQLGEIKEQLREGLPKLP